MNVPLKISCDLCRENGVCNLKKALQLAELVDVVVTTAVNFGHSVNYEYTYCFHGMFASGRLKYLLLLTIAIRLPP